MNEVQRLFLVQARSTYAVYNLLKDHKLVHHCHKLHYLQMSTELLGKAHAWRCGPIGKSHQAPATFLRTLSSNKKAQRGLGYDRKNEQWTHTIRKSIPLAESLQNMAPALSKDGPNPEYPWPWENPIATPSEHKFQIWIDLTESKMELRFLRYLKDFSLKRMNICNY